LNPNFYDENFVQGFYSPASKVIYENLSKDVPEIDEYVLESEIRESLIVAFPPDELEGFLRRLVSDLRNLELDLVNGYEGLEIDLSLFRSGLATFSTDLANRLYDKLPACSVNSAELCINKEMPKELALERFSTEMKFALQRELPASIKILNFEGMSASQDFPITEISWQTVLLFFFSVSFVLFALSFFLLWKPFSFTFSYFGGLFLVLSFTSFFVKLGLVKIFEESVSAGEEFAGLDAVLYSFLENLLGLLGRYAIYEFLFGVILIVLGAYFHRESLKTLEYDA